MDRREHFRVQLRIPARLRWTTPLGQMSEICETLNVSRGGLLLPCKENHPAGTSLWITFPFDATLPFGQPEVLAHVVRSELVATRTLAAHGNGQDGKNPTGDPTAGAQLDHTYAQGEMVFAAYAAVRLEAKPRSNSNKSGNGHHNGHGNGNGHHPEVERRTSTRRVLAVPIRVRVEHVPWFEETMTMDASNEGLRFVTCREYQPGHHLMVSFEDSVLSPWPVAAEFRCLVVRVDSLPQSQSLAVTVYRVQ